MHSINTTDFLHSGFFKLTVRFLLFRIAEEWQQPCHVEQLWHWQPCRMQNYQDYQIVFRMKALKVFFTSKKHSVVSTLWWHSSVQYHGIVNSVIINYRHFFQRSSTQTFSFSNSSSHFLLFLWKSPHSPMDHYDIKRPWKITKHPTEIKTDCCRKDTDAAKVFLFTLK